MQELLLNKGSYLFYIFLLLNLLIGCDQKPAKDSAKENPVIISNNHIALNVLLTKGFEKSYEVQTPFSGIRIINPQEQIYGFISIKNVKYTDYNNSDDLLLQNFNYDIDNFLDQIHWNQYLNSNGITVDQKQTSYFIKHDIWDELIIGKRYKIQFPGTININTLQVGEYIEQIMSTTQMASPLKIRDISTTEWYNDSIYIISFIETLISPELSGGTSKILTSIIVTPFSKKGTLYEKLFIDLSYNTNVCIGRCTVKRKSDTFSIKATSPVELLFFLRNSQGMEYEINNFFTNIIKPLTYFMNSYSIPFKLALTTISDPDNLRSWNNKYWIDQNDSNYSEFFNIPITNYIRNNLIALGPQAVSTAMQKNVFSNSQEKILIFFADKDDQSTTQQGEPISLNNLDKFIQYYRDFKIFPVAIIPLTEQETPTCNQPQQAKIFSSFIFKANGIQTNICSQHQNSFIQALTRKGMLDSSHAHLSQHPSLITTSCTFNHKQLYWNFPQGYFIDPYLNKIIITPPSNGEGKITYFYFSSP